MQMPMMDSDESGTGQDEPTPAGLVKVTVNLVPAAYAALVEAAKAAGDTRTDTVNRALLLYEVISRFQAQGWDILAHRHRRRNRLWALLAHWNCETKSLRANSGLPQVPGPSPPCGI